MEILRCLQIIIMHPAPHKGKLPLIFRIGGAKDNGVLWMDGLDTGRNQLRGAVPHEDMFSRSSCVGGYGTAESGVIPVRISA